MDKDTKIFGIFDDDITEEEAADMCASKDACKTCDEEYDTDTLEGQGWEKVESKYVTDESGFQDIYYWYKNPKSGLHRFYFASDVDYGDPEYFDWETENEQEAKDWFDSYGEEEESEYLDFQGHDTRTGDDYDANERAWSKDVDLDMEESRHRRKKKATKLIKEALYSDDDELVDNYRGIDIRKFTSDHGPEKYLYTKESDDPKDYAEFKENDVDVARKYIDTLLDQGTDAANKYWDEIYSTVPNSENVKEEKSNLTEENTNTRISQEERDLIDKIINRGCKLWSNAPSVISSHTSGGDYIVEMGNSNPTYLSSLWEELWKLEDSHNIGFDRESNDNGFYGYTYTFYHYEDDEDEDEDEDEVVDKDKYFALRSIGESATETSQEEGEPVETEFDELDYLTDLFNVERLPKDNSVPAFKESAVNEFQFPKGMRAKYYDAWNDGDSLFVEWITQEPFTAEDADAFKKEVERFFQYTVDHAHFEYPKTVKVKVTCRDGKEDGFATFELKFGDKAKAECVSLKEADSELEDLIAVRLNKFYDILSRNAIVTLTNSQLDKVYYEGSVRDIPAKYDDCVVEDFAFDGGNALLFKIKVEDATESLTEDTVKLKDGKWANKGKEVTHGTFRTKKAADAQRRAMFAQGYKESLSEGIGGKDGVLIGYYTDPKKEDYEDIEYSQYPNYDERVTVIGGQRVPVVIYPHADGDPGHSAYFALKRTDGGYKHHMPYVYELKKFIDRGEIELADDWEWSDKYPHLVKVVKEVFNANADDISDWDFACQLEPYADDGVEVAYKDTLEVDYPRGHRRKTPREWSRRKAVMERSTQLKEDNDEHPNADYIRDAWKNGYLKDDDLITYFLDKTPDDMLAELRISAANAKKNLDVETTADDLSFADVSTVLSDPNEKFLTEDTTSMNVSVDAESPATIKAEVKMDPAADVAVDTFDVVGNPEEDDLSITDVDLV